MKWFIVVVVNTKQIGMKRDEHITTVFRHPWSIHEHHILFFSSSSSLSKLIDRWKAFFRAQSLARSIDWSFFGLNGVSACTLFPSLHLPLSLTIQIRVCVFVVFSWCADWWSFIRKLGFPTVLHLLLLPPQSILHSSFILNPRTLSISPSTASTLFLSLSLSLSLCVLLVV